MKRSVLIVDDHPIMRRGVVSLIGVEKDLEITSEAGTAAEAITILESIDLPDLAIVDLSLPDKSGLELTKDIVALYPDLKVLVMSMHEESRYCERVLRAGARGYIMKEAAAENLVRAIRRVLDGQIYVSDSMSSNLLEILAGRRPTSESSPIERLTDREIEVYEWIGRGKGSREIASQLNISIRTVDAHRAHLKEKLGVKDSNSLVRSAVKWVESEQPDRVR
ncbi:MAG: DNA-binding NarL/FixJ family response regulator [Verrucomicrobiales bacterium]|jgi:DNA-binding NarL/FixJ family response regulator